MKIISFFKERLFTGLIICCTIFSVGCGKNGDPAPADACAGTSFKFTADVQPIVNSSCATSSNCHGAGSVNSGGAFTDYNKIFSRRTDIKTQISAGLMPKFGSLTTDQKNKIICWINSGAPNN